MEMQHAHYRQTLRKHLELRTTQNARYSLRAYARDLGLSTSQVSQVLNGKLGLSLRYARQIVAKLSLSEIETQTFLDSVTSLHSRRVFDRKAAKARLLKDDTRFSNASLDHFRLISEWHHLAILQLIDVKGFRAEPDWIALQLKISAADADQALKRLIRLGLLKRVKGKLAPANAFNSYTNGQPSDAVRRFHLQIFDRAKRALLFDSVDQRDFSNMVMSMNSKRYPEVAERLKIFRRQLAVDLSKDDERDAVFCFSQQLFQLKGDQNHE